MFNFKVIQVCYIIIINIQRYQICSYCFILIKVYYICPILTIMDAFIFSFRIFFTDTYNSEGSRRREETIYFIPLYRYHLFTNIQTFICNYEKWFIDYEMLISMSFLTVYAHIYDNTHFNPQLFGKMHSRYSPFSPHVVPLDHSKRLLSQ